MFSIRDIEQQAEEKKLSDYLDSIDAADAEAEREEAEAEAEKDER